MESPRYDGGSSHAYEVAGRSRPPARRPQTQPPPPIPFQHQLCGVVQNSFSLQYTTRGLPTCTTVIVYHLAARHYPIIPLTLTIYHAPSWNNLNSIYGFDCLTVYDVILKTTKQAGHSTPARHMGFSRRVPGGLCWSFTRWSLEMLGGRRESTCSFHKLER